MGCNIMSGKQLEIGKEINRIDDEMVIPSLSDEIDFKKYRVNSSVLCGDVEVSPDFFFDYYVNKNVQQKGCSKISPKNHILTNATQFLGNVYYLC
jgi:hypothetical protein